MIQNAAARLVFSEPKRVHVTPLFISLHWLPVAARIKFKTLMLAYRTATGSAPAYFHSLLRIYIPSRSLRATSEQRLVVPSQRGTKSLSRTFSFTVPGWWNELLTPIRNAESLTIFKQHLKTHLFRLLHKKKIKNTFAPFPFPSPCLASFCYEQWLKCCITSTSCDRLPLYNVSLIVFLNCKSLWIKVSAKWIKNRQERHSSSKNYNGQHLLSLNLHQTHMNFFLLLNKKIFWRKWIFLFFLYSKWLFPFLGEL